MPVTRVYEIGFKVPEALLRLQGHFTTFNETKRIKHHSAIRKCFRCIVAEQHLLSERHLRPTVKARYQRWGFLRIDTLRLWEKGLRNSCPDCERIVDTKEGPICHESLGNEHHVRKVSSLNTHISAVNGKFTSAGWSCHSTCDQSEPVFCNVRNLTAPSG